MRGLGEKRIQILKEAGLTDAEDLAAFFPREYFDCRDCALANATREKCAVLATVTSAPSVRFVKRGLSITRIVAEDTEKNAFTAVFYNRPYMKAQVIVGACYYFFGNLEKKRAVTMLNPLMERAENVNGAFYTVYPTVKGIPRTVLKDAVMQAVEETAFQSIIPETERAALGLDEPSNAYMQMHLPDSHGALERAKRTVAVEELTQLIITYFLTKANSDRTRKFSYLPLACELAQTIASLPYELTACQKRVWEEVRADLLSHRRMNRLIQGDVGSGKTILAFLAMYFVAKSGKQSVLMAPTEVLAVQHFQKFTAQFPQIPCVLLCGGLTAKESATARARMATGEALVAIGTHSLFQKKSEYADLALVVTDEQHRFGVGQRAAIEQKGATTDTLIMSATPIPRTMSLILYGDLDVSILDEKPSGRKEISTKFVPTHKREDMLMYVRDEAMLDHRAYIVLPRVETDEDDDAESAKSVYEELTKSVLKNTPTGLLYGGMSDKKKNETLAKFQSGALKVLVSTTVIEVGIDVPEANIMIILDADRFGLSQLHQLRGRVGRGERESYCFLLSDTSNPESKKRLEMLKNCSDGFRLAEYDLETRGAGDFIGTNQHGFGSVSNLMLTKPIIAASRELAERLMATNTYRLTKFRRRYRELVQNVTLN